MIFTNALLKEIEKAEHALILYIDDLISTEILTSCLSKMDKGIALDLFLNHENKILLNENPFLLNKCIQLTNKGASIFMIDKNTAPFAWKCYVDFKEISYHSLSEQKIIHKKEEDNSFLIEPFLEFERKRAEATPYLTDNGDLRINFNVSTPAIMSGDPVELKWEVKGAHKVIIQGLGEVEAFGRKKIFPEKDTVLKIGASNNHQTQIKAIPVLVSETAMMIQYSIGFINAKTKEYSSLINTDTFPHVYGISKGDQLKLSWKIPRAQAVTIMPFDLTETSGEFYFTPSESLLISIKATIGTHSLTRNIQVLLFPVPLFKEKLFPLTFLKNKKRLIPPALLLKDQSKKMRKEEEQRYRDLTQKITTHHLLIRSKKFNLKTINIFLFDILRKKYSHRKGILQQINSIRSYYEQPSSGRGTSDRSHQSPA